MFLLDISAGWIQHISELLRDILKMTRTFRRTVRASSAKGERPKKTRPFNYNLTDLASFTAKKNPYSKKKYLKISSD